jgi:hypothetical protein
LLSCRRSEAECREGPTTRTPFNRLFGGAAIAALALTSSMVLAQSSKSVIVLATSSVMGDSLLTPTCSRSDAQAQAAALLSGKQTATESVARHPSARASRAGDAQAQAAALLSPPRMARQMIAAREHHTSRTPPFSGDAQAQAAALMSQAQKLRSASAKNEEKKPMRKLAEDLVAVSELSPEQARRDTGGCDLRARHRRVSAQSRSPR